MAVGTAVAICRWAAGVGVRGKVALTDEFEPHPRPVEAPSASPASRQRPEMEIVAFFMR